VKKIIETVNSILANFNSHHCAADSDKMMDSEHSDFSVGKLDDFFCTNKLLLGKVLWQICCQANLK
jgi:hypothetical protein